MERKEEGGVLIGFKTGGCGENNHMEMISRNEIGMGAELGAALGNLEAMLIRDETEKPACDAFTGVKLAIRKGKSLGRL